MVSGSQLPGSTAAIAICDMHLSVPPVDASEFSPVQSINEKRVELLTPIAAMRTIGVGLVRQRTLEGIDTLRTNQLYVGKNLEINNRATSLHGFVPSITTTVVHHPRPILFSLHTTRSPQHGLPLLSHGWQHVHSSVNRRAQIITCACSRQFHHWTWLPETRCFDVWPSSADAD